MNLNVPAKTNDSTWTLKTDEQRRKNRIKDSLEFKIAENDCGDLVKTEIIDSMNEE